MATPSSQIWCWERNVADGPFDTFAPAHRVTADSSPPQRDGRHVPPPGAADGRTAGGTRPTTSWRKGSFWRLAYSYTQGRQHHEDHFGQIRAAIEAAWAHPRR
jgi:hypothetical protein